MALLMMRSKAPQPCPLPSELSLALRQYATMATPLVAQGDTVLAGQCIADSQNGVPVYAPLGGVVSKLTRQSIQIRVDATAPPASTPPTTKPLPVTGLSPFAAKVRQGGIVGLGGAAFPAHRKWAQKARILVVNALQCEAPIQSDSAVLHHDTASVMRGAALVAEALEVETVIVANKASDHVSSATIKAYLDTHYPAWQHRPVKGDYPLGAERPLLRALGFTPPDIPSQAGMVVSNVATLAATAHWVDHGRPLTHRVITVAAPHQYHNFMAPLGTALQHLLYSAGLKTGQQQYRLGGAQSGQMIHDLSQTFRKRLVKPMFIATMEKDMINVVTNPIRSAKATLLLRSSFNCEFINYRIKAF